MASTAQIEANRRNAQRSTGPKTEQGKAASSRNALKHGLCAATAVLPGEDPAEFEAFAARFKNEANPHGVQQELLVDRLTLLHWKLQRLPAMEQAAVKQLAPSAADLMDVAAAMERDLNEPDSLGRLERLQRYEGRITREIRAVTKELRLLKQDAGERREEEHHAFCDGYNRALYDTRGKWPKPEVRVPEWVRDNYNAAKPSEYQKPNEPKFERADESRMYRWDFEQEMGKIEWIDPVAEEGEADEEAQSAEAEPQSASEEPVKILPPADPAPAAGCAARVA